MWDQRTDNSHLCSHIVTVSFFYTSTMTSFHFHLCWLLFSFSGFPHCPWVWTLIKIAAYIRTTLLINHVVAIYTLFEYWFCTLPKQWRRRHQWQPILQLHCTSFTSSCHWRPTCQNRPGLLYDGTSLIASEGGNTRGIWRPPHCGHQQSCCRPRQNRLTTEEYLWSILLVWRNYRKWKKIPKVKPSLRNSIGLPPGWGYRSAPEVTRSSGV